MHSTMPAAKYWSDPHTQITPDLNTISEQARHDTGRAPDALYLSPCVLASLSRNIQVQDNYPGLLQPDTNQFLGIPLRREAHPNWTDQDVVVMAAGREYVIRRVIRPEDDSPPQSYQQTSQTSWEPR